MNEKKEEAIKELQDLEKNNKKVKEEWSELEDKNWFPFKEMLKTGKKWTWYQR